MLQMQKFSIASLRRDEKPINSSKLAQLCLVQSRPSLICELLSDIKLKHQTSNS